MREYYLFLRRQIRSNVMALALFEIALLVVLSLGLMTFGPSKQHVNLAASVATASSQASHAQTANATTQLSLPHSQQNSTTNQTSKSVNTPTPSSATDKGKTDAVMPRYSVSKTPAPDLYKPIPPLTGINVVGNTNRPTYFWWSPTGGMPPTAGYILYWVQGCYRLNPNCMTVSNLEATGTKVVVGDASHYQILGNYDESNNLYAIVCANVNGKCGVTSNLAIIPGNYAIYKPVP